MRTKNGRTQVAIGSHVPGHHRLSSPAQVAFQSAVGIRSACVVRATEVPCRLVPGSAISGTASPVAHPRGPLFCFLSLGVYLPPLSTSPPAVFLILFQVVYSIPVSVYFRENRLPGGKIGTMRQEKAMTFPRQKKNTSCPWFHTHVWRLTLARCPPFLLCSFLDAPSLPRLEGAAD